MENEEKYWYCPSKFFGEKCKKVEDEKSDIKFWSKDQKSQCDDSCGLPSELQHYLSSSFLPIKDRSSLRSTGATVLYNTTTLDEKLLLSLMSPTHLCKSEETGERVFVPEVVDEKGKTIEWPTYIPIMVKKSDEKTIEKIESMLLEGRGCGVLNEMLERLILMDFKKCIPLAKLYIKIVESSILGGCPPVYFSSQLDLPQLVKVAVKKISKSGVYIDDDRSRMGDQLSHLYDLFYIFTDLVQQMLRIKNYPKDEEFGPLDELDKEIQENINFKDFVDVVSHGLMDAYPSHVDEQVVVPFFRYCLVYLPNLMIEILKYILGESFNYNVPLKFLQFLESEYGSIFSQAILDGGKINENNFIAKLRKLLDLYYGRQLQQQLQPEEFELE
jgi:hypothetical protein